MPKPIGSEAPAAHTIDLEPVLITASPTKPSAGTPVPVADIALQCADEGAAVAVALLSRTQIAPATLLLAAGGASAALAGCVVQTVQHAETAASIRRALDRCVDAGGTPAGVLDGELTCLVSE
jgi:hypothetical protein